MRYGSRAAPLAAFAAGLLALAVAWYAEHRMGLVPCALCRLERWPWRALAAAGLAALLIPRVRPLAMAFAWMAVLAAVGLSAAHLGVEQGWWPDPWPACAAPHFRPGNLQARLAAMPLRPVRPCDQPARLFNFLPLSMSALDLIYAGLTSVTLVLCARPSIRRALPA